MPRRPSYFRVLGVKSPVSGASTPTIPEARNDLGKAARKNNTLVRHRSSESLGIRREGGRFQQAGGNRRCRFQGMEKNRQGSCDQRVGGLVFGLMNELAGRSNSCRAWWGGSCFRRGWFRSHGPLGRGSGGFLCHWLRINCSAPLTSVGFGFLSDKSAGCAEGWGAVTSGRFGRVR